MRERFKEEISLLVLSGVATVLVGTLAFFLNAFANSFVAKADYNEDKSIWVEIKTQIAFILKRQDKIAKDIDEIKKSVKE